MNKVLIATLFLLFAFPVLSAADILNMKDGSTIEGEIVGENSFSYSVKVGKKVQRVFKDKVKSIDKKALKVEPSGLMKQLEKEGYVSKEEMDNLEELTDEKKDLIKKLLEINGTLALMESNKQDMLKRAQGDEYRKIDDLINIEDLTDELVPIFAKYYTLEDLKTIVTFYESAPGQKVIKSTQNIMQEVVRASLAYFQKRLKNQ